MYGAKTARAAVFAGQAGHADADGRAVGACARARLCERRKRALRGTMKAIEMSSEKQLKWSRARLWERRGRARRAKGG